MSLSLQEQLLKAGLGDKKKAQKINKEKRKQSKIARTQKKIVADETRESVEKQLAEKKAKDQALNQANKAAAEKKAIEYQIKQLVSMNQIQRTKGEIVFNFTDGTKIKRLLINEQTQQNIQNRKIAVARLDEGFVLVSMKVAEKILERDENDTIVYRAEKDGNNETTNSEEEDWYADYEVPDDMMW